MQARIDFVQHAPNAYQGLAQAKKALAESTLGKALVDLVYLRVSQINGCAYCVDRHARDLLAAGEPLHRVNSLVTWREVAFYSDRERAALAWAEYLTRLPISHSGQDPFESLHVYFNEAEQAELLMAVALMNALNRLGVGAKMVVAAS
ncbi:AhpD family alkylhydroperoxidase [Chitinivorax tropicus]|uniref:AhpD family alkylhydroperoxidase n=1 Tax=Chitinivorax tropicus TaxID=714531 RepID=A0A840MIQ6_9PROT|nr:carboxymuconolactone decarboxylase family protein [Chitinivorax tropicus]MBB5018290.1 AhpD family alkylhydroperoxidase [Chitinivorax tropicus]